MGMFVVISHTHLVNFGKPETYWSVINRKTKEEIGCYQQLGIANMTAALMNRMNLP